MFCYQREFRLPTEIVTQELLHQLVGSPQTRWLTQEHRRWRDNMPSIVADSALQEEWAKDEEFQKFCIEEPTRLRKQKDGKKKAEAFEALPLAKKMQTYCDSLKKSLPFVIFIATYAETPSAKGQKMGAWRKQAACQLNGLCVIDFDHIEGDPREVWAAAYAKLSEEDKQKILFVFVTPSGHGLKVVFIADVSIGNLIDNQKAFSLKLGLNPDEACKDASRGAFLTTSDDIIFIDEERLINYESEEFGKKFDAEYHAGHSAPTKTAAVADTKVGQGTEAVGPVDDQTVVTYNDVPILKIIEAWMEGRNLTNHRHDTLVELSDHLRYLIGKNPTKITEVVMQLPWVQDLAAEGEDVAGTVSSIMGWRYKQKKPEEVLKALEKVGALSSRPCGEISDSSTSLGMTGNDNDVYAVLPLEEWAKELLEMAEYYPCLKELFLNVHPHKLPAVWFSSAAMFGTLMTRAWYHFWYEPEIVRRLNYSIFIIGDPGAGKNVIEKFYKKIADPMI